MPRRHTSSAAGVLAATLLAAVVAPAVAQDAPGLRGSIGSPLDATTAPATLPGSRALPLRGGILDDPDGGSSALVGTGQDGLANDLVPTAVGGEPLGGLGDDATAGGSPQGPAVTATNQLRRSTVDPGLRGTVVSDEAVPGFGIDQGRAEPPGEEDPFGTPLITPLRSDILDIDPAEDPLGLRVRQLDPFVPLGTRLGSFILFAEAEIGAIFTDNVLGLPDPISDYAFEFAPEVRLESDWERHGFEAEFTADRSWYNTFSVEDDRIYAALLRGRLDVGARTNLELELGKAQTQDGRNAISITNIAGFQTNVQQEEISATVRHNFNRLTIEAEGSISTFDYEDLTGTQLAVATTFTGLTIPQADNRDFQENELTLRGTYEFNPGLSFFVEGEIAQDIYEQPVTVAGITRDSSGFATLAGIEYAVSDAFYGNLSVGWGEQNSIAEDTASIEGVLFNADLVWMPTPMTLVEFLASSSVQTSNLVDSLGAISRSYRLSLQQAFWRYLVVGGYVSYEVADYVDNPLVDERLREGVTLEYFFNPNMSFYSRYEHTDFFSTDRFAEFTENEFRVGLRIRN
ncbi:MAG: outer membrane beta-barrel protein [Methyloceanibacter sp.]|nr:outer membrane beta-barrel protein [Methyloceanibacter sp.]